MIRQSQLAFVMALGLSIMLTFSSCGSLVANQKPASEPDPAFSLALDTRNISAQQGQTAQATLTITPQNGFTGTVNLSLRSRDGGNAPSGITMSPDRINVSSSNPISQAIIISVSSNVAPDNYQLQFVGTSNGKSEHVDFNLTVIANSSGATFELAISPSDLIVEQGQATQATLTITPQNGFTGVVNLLVRNQNGIAASGITINPNRIEVTNDNPINQTITISADDSVTPSDYALVIVGSYGGTLVQGYAYFTLTVNGEVGNMPWNERLLSSGQGTFRLNSVAYGGNTFVAVGYGTILTSTNGIDWTSRQATGYNLSDVTYGSGVFVAVGSKAGAGVALTSLDGASWTEHGLDTTASLMGVTYGSNTFVAVGDGGSIFTSPDGASWTKQNSGGDGYLFDATYGGNTFVVVSTMSTILTSEDAVSWTTRHMGIEVDLWGVTYGNGTFVAVGPGAVFTSADGVDWTARSLGTRYYLEDVAYGGDKFVAVDRYGAILTSTDGAMWVLQRAGENDYKWLYGVTYGNDSFVAVGEYDDNGSLILTSP